VTSAMSAPGTTVTSTEATRNGSSRWSSTGTRQLSASAGST
jgi:hypothetical protein